jgi:hypothetical protein
MGTRLRVLEKLRLRVRLLRHEVSKEMYLEI